LRFFLPRFAFAFAFAALAGLPLPAQADAPAAARPAPAEPATDPVERLRWEDAQWSDEIVWARDRQSRQLLALIGVRFEAEPVDGFAPEPARYATAVFSYHKGRWRTDGRHIDEIGPDEAFRRHREFEPVAPPYRRP
jgi:hypothetical protein